MASIVHVVTVPQTLVFLEQEIQESQRRGHSVEVICSDGALRSQYGDALGITTHVVDMKRAISPMADLVAAKQVAQILGRLAPDLVVSHTPKAGLLGMIGAYLAGVPNRVYNLRGLVTLTATGRRKSILEAAETTSCHLAQVVICQSRSLRAHVLERSIVEADKALVLGDGSNGVDTDYFDPANWTGSAVAADFGIPPNSEVVGFVGRLVGDKGINELAQAWSEVRERHATAYLLIVGPIEDRDGADPATLDGLQKDPRVVFAGFQKELPRFYAAMDLVVLPTYREGFPVVPLEAASMGLPVVTTDAIGAVDAVDDGVTGAIVPVRNSHVLAEAMDAYLGSKMKRHAHGRAGRERVIRKFNSDLVCGLTLDLYEDLMEVP